MLPTLDIAAFFFSLQNQPPNCCSDSKSDSKSNPGVVMGRRGNGCLTKRRDGRWQAAIMAGGRRLTAYAKTKAEAQAKLKELKQKAASGAVGRKSEALPEETYAFRGSAAAGLEDTDPGVRERAVAALLDDWLAAGNYKAGALIRYRSMIRTNIIPHIGDVELSKLTPVHVQKLYETLKEKPSVADKVHRILHRAFRRAVLWGVLAENPCDKAVKPRYRTNGKKIWGIDELKRFLQGARGHWLYPLWVLAIATGCRLGELLALRWGDVDLKVGTITISSTLSWVEGGPVFEAPKTPAANRTLALIPGALDILRSTRGKHEYETPDFLVFMGPKSGAPIHPSVVSHALRRECRRLGLPEITPHGLRHLHASLLLSNGVPVPLVCRQLGHATPGVTMTIYAHVIGPGSQVTRALEGILSTPTEQARPTETGP
ncbi:MAG: site-specific integrase [Candidatus Methanomethyliaceae archaeon]